MNWEKIDKFYVVLSVVLVLMSVLVIVSFRGLFSAFLSAYEIDQDQANSQVRVDKESLDEAAAWVSERESVPFIIN